MHKNLRNTVVKGFDVFNKKWFPPCLRASVVKGFYVSNKELVFSVSPCLCGEKSFMFLTKNGFLCVLRAPVVNK